MRSFPRSSTVGFALVLFVAIGFGETRAATIQSLIDNNNGMIQVGMLKFTFEAGAVTGDRTAAQIEVTPVDSNGIEFRLNPGFMLLSDMVAAQTQSVTITYTVMSICSFTAAGMDSGNFAQNTANGASAGATTTFAENNVMLYKGSPPPDTVKMAAIPNLPTTLTVTNVGRVHVPLRGQGGSQDEAQLTTITNTFAVVPEPSTFALAALAGAGAVLSAPRRARSWRRGLKSRLR